MGDAYICWLSEQICYVAPMRTTLVLDDSLYQRAKVAAAQRGVTVAALIEDGLHLLLSAPAVDPDRGAVPVNSQMGWVRPGIDIDDSSALLDALDADMSPDALR